MRVILLSGGSGKRLWPLSNEHRAKQFLQLLDDGENGRQSMVQRIWHQLKDAGLSNSTVIATSLTQADMLYNQLGESVKLVIEPERRDTFPAIALTVSYLHSVEDLAPQEAVVVLPVDLFVNEGFFQQLMEMEKVLLETGADLALLGVVPTCPTEKYGYIVPESEPNDFPFLRVHYFQEKPSLETARELIARQALWNCGVFAFKTGYLFDKLEESGFPTEYRELQKSYGQLPPISFDYQIVEKTGNVIVLRYQGTWTDLGNWEDFTERMSSPVIGMGKLSQNSLNTHLINELNLPVLVLGISNAIIAACPNGILVADKRESAGLKDMVDGLGQRPVFEERPWGKSWVLDHHEYENDRQVLTRRVRITAGKNISCQLHYKRDEVWTIVQGQGQLVLDGVLHQVEAGDVWQIPAGVKHELKADTDLEFIEVQRGTELSEDGIVKVGAVWDEEGWQ